MNPINSSRRIPELDGLRGLAILMVLASHYFGASIFAPDRSGLAYLQALLEKGALGVDLFFVLSGFLIGGILLDNRGCNNYFKAFYARRMFRIFPLYYAVLAAFVLATAVLPRARFGSLFDNPLPMWPYFLYVQNIARVGIIPTGTRWLGPTWSLAIEEQFYLVLPALVWAVKPKRLGFVLASLAFGGPILRALEYPFLHAHGVWIFTVGRIDALMLGALLAYLLRKQEWQDKAVEARRVLYGFLAIFVAGLAVLQVLPQFANACIGYSWNALGFGTLLVLVVTHPGGMLGRLFRARGLGRIGMISYAIYLLHQPIIGLLFGITKQSEPRLNSIGSLALTVVALGMTYLMASISWVCFERPLLKIGRSIKYESAAQPQPVLAAVHT